MRAMGSFGRALLIGGGVVVIALVGVHAYNATRVDIGGLRASAETILERAHDVSARARPEYEELALATLPPNPLNGPFYRLDDLLHRAKVVEQPGGVVMADGAVLHAFEFESGGAPGLVKADGADAPSVEDGILKIPAGDRDDYLTNAQAMAVPADDIGDVLIRVAPTRRPRYDWGGRGRRAPSAFGSIRSTSASWEIASSTPT
jgi:hypothetical protein